MQKPFSYLIVIVLSSATISLPVPKILSAAEPMTEDYQRLGAVFYPKGLSDFWDKPWVEIDTGPSNWTRTVEGWWLEERERQLLVLDLEGEIHSLRKPRVDEKRPRLPEDDGGFISNNSIRDADYSVLWGMTLQNFDERSDEFLKAGAPKEEDLPDNILMPMIVHRSQARRHIVDAARYAYLAKMRGRDRHAAELYSHANEIHRQFLRRQVGSPAELEDLYRFVTEIEATGLRNSAVFSANRGAPRGELLKLWQRVFAIPDHSFHEEAETMIEGYQQLLTEDGKWQEPTPEQLAKFTTRKQVNFWLYKLRDHDSAQREDPGMCNVFVGGWGNGDVPNPATKLEELGITAIPVLIEHMDDMRPTRCEGHTRRYLPDSYRLLRYGDCCQQIFEAITGHKIYRRKTTNSYPTYDGSAADCKAKAQAWWDEYQKKEQAK